MKLFLKITGIGCSTLVVLVLALLFFIGSVAPETFIYLGNEVPGKFLKKLQALDLLDEGETIQYFYSDAMFDVTASMYFLTDRKLVLRSEEWQEPTIAIPFSDIESLDIFRDTSFFADSTVFVTTKAGDEYSFPLSSEKGLDERFYETLKAKAEV